MSSIHIHINGLELVLFLFQTNKIETIAIIRFFLLLMLTDYGTKSSQFLKMFFSFLTDARRPYLWRFSLFKNKSSGGPEPL